MSETWKDAPGYRGKYSVSDHGQVRSNWRLNNNGSVLVRTKIMAQYRRPKGYKVVKLMIDGKAKLIGVHRLVLLTFVGPPEKEQEGAHLDGNPSNNVLTNLKWATGIENASHKLAHGTKVWGERSYSAILKEQDVLKIRKLYDGGMRPAHIAKQLGVGYHIAYDAATGRSWPHLPLAKRGAP